MTRKQNRYYKVGERVYVKELNKCGVIKSMTIKPEEGIYKASVELRLFNGSAIHITTREFDLWEIDKDKRVFSKGREAVGLDKGYFQVRDFHKAFGHPVAYKPTFIDAVRLVNRVKWTQEELQELLDAKDVVGQADAVIDAIYFLLGTLVEMGVRPDRLFDIVQQANMGKLHEVDGKLVPVYRTDGKVKKPENWERDFAPEPKLKAEIERQYNKY